MTLIMSYQGKNALVLLGDLMLSQDNERAEAIEWPTRYDAGFALESRNVSGLYQKILNIKPKLAAGWAGNWLIARHILLEISKGLAEPYTGERILRRIYSLGLSERELREVAFIFWSMTEWPNIQVQDFNCGETVNPSDPTEKFKYAGSGTYHFFDTIGFNLKQGAEHSEWSNAIGTVLGRAAMAFHSELVSNEPHWYRYGGGFEAMVPSVCGFQKVPLAFVFWTFDGKEIALVGPLFSQSYNESGGLALRRFMPVVPTNGQWMQRIFPVRSFFAESEIDCDPSAQIDAQWSIHYIIDKRRPNAIQFLQRTGPNNTAVSWDGQRVQAQFTPHFVRDVNGLLGFVGG
jgi:hypothetical protein